MAAGGLRHRNGRVTTGPAPSSRVGWPVEAPTTNGRAVPTTTGRRGITSRHRARPCQLGADPYGAGQLVWLDLGSVGVLDAGLRASLVRLLVAVDGGDPDDLRRRLTTEAVLLLPMLRRLPHRVDRIVGALEAGTLTVRVDPRAGHLARPAAGVVGQLVTSALAAATGLMAALLLTAPTGPEVGPGLALNGLLGYLLLMVAAVLGLRALVRSYRS